MQHMYHPEEAIRVNDARMSYSGRLLTDRQYEDMMALTAIIERRIEETGSFKDCLTDYANATARTERFDAMKADSIIRDLFKARTGVTMNELREAFMAREKTLFDKEHNPAEQERQKAYRAAVDSGRTVEQGDKINFHRALNFEAVQLARDLTITHVGAKKLMEQCFEDTEGRSLRDWGKELDEKHYRPQIEAEKKQRTETRSSTQARLPSY